MPHAGWYFHYGVQGDERMFATADIPEYPTGEFPIQPDDPAYQFDHNPNTIKRAGHRLRHSGRTDAGRGARLRAGSDRHSCFRHRAVQFAGRSRAATRSPTRSRTHARVIRSPAASITIIASANCVLEKFDTGTGHSALVGYIVDGFGIYGPRGEDGEELGSADLDECHGHTHKIEWNGKMVEMYHYHATLDFPYTVGCMRGAYSNDDVMMISGPRVEMQLGQGRPNGRPNLEQAAAKLGVTEATLIDALGKPPPDLAAAAKKLGIDEKALTSALGLP